MEVKAGYKRTDAGVIPEDWETSDLGELLVFKNGLNKAKEFFGYGTPIVNYMDVYGKRGIYASELHGRVSLSKQELKAFEVRKGDVFFTRTSETAAEVGMTCVMLDEPQDTVFSGFVLRGRPKKISLDDQFKKYCFSTGIVRDQITSQSTETTRALTNGRYLSAVTIALPSIPEQRAIAEALSDVDALLGALDQLIAKKRDLKQAALQQLLTGKTRLPGFHGEWQETTLGEIGVCIIGLTYKPENVVEHGMLVLRSSNVQNGELTYDDNVYVNLEIPEHLITRPGDILICVRNGSRALIGKCAIIDQPATGVTFGAFMSVYRTKYSRYIFHVFQADAIQKQIHENIGATINQITNKDMKAFRVKLPPEDEQTAIAEVLSDMDAELAALEQRRAKTHALKQGMMQELLTGRTRLV
jgi:type I restriction enzyme S subunit